MDEDGDTEPVPVPEPEDGFRDALVEAMGEVDRLERSKTFSATDSSLGAFFSVLQENDEEREKIVDALKDALGKDEDEEVKMSRENIVRMCVIVGLKEVAPEYVKELEKAAKKYKWQ
ncbi:MAG: hypothetical protein SXQ77_01765 [Halobacteria archaeon]|nr:hypothetical protein [Halobacteria archaeon]